MKEQAVADAQVVDEESPGPDSIVPDVAATVAKLPVQQRAAIYLVYWEGLEPSEAAAVIGVQPGTIRRYLHLARSQLRRHLDG